MTEQELVQAKEKANSLTPGTEIYIQFNSDKVEVVPFILVDYQPGKIIAIERQTAVNQPQNAKTRISIIPISNVKRVLVV